MASVVTFAQLPDEVPEFLGYLEKTGDIWARAQNDDPLQPKYAPSPASAFLAHFGAQIATRHVISIYLGFREEVLNPALYSHETIEGGKRVPFVQNGTAVSNAYSIVGGTKKQRIVVDLMGSPLLSCSIGQLLNETNLAHSNICFYPGHFIGQKWVPNPPEFIKWGKKILGWIRRRATEQVPIDRANYSIRATARVAEACRSGLVVS